MLTISDISTSQYSSDGSPWINITLKDSVDVNTLQYSFDGSPWYGVPAENNINSNFLMWFM